MNKNIIIASTSTIFGGNYLEYLNPAITEIFQKNNKIIFIPYARPDGISYDAYTEKATKAFEKIGLQVSGIHTFDNPKSAIQEAGGIFVGGGNTFLLVQTLYKMDLMNTISEVVKNGTPYLGTSAGSNITGLSMQTTNDMPIVYPPSFQTLGLVPFNINPHYLDPIEGSTHMGETRETRIKEFHTINNIPVIGLREGSWLEVKNKKITLKGNLSARIFEANKTAFEVETGSDLTYLGNI